MVFTDYLPRATEYNLASGLQGNLITKSPLSEGLLRAVPSTFFHAFFHLHHSGQNNTSLRSYQYYNVRFTAPRHVFARGAFRVGGVEMCRPVPRAEAGLRSACPFLRVSMPGVPGERGNRVSVDLGCGKETGADLREGVPRHEGDAMDKQYLTNFRRRKFPQYEYLSLEKWVIL